jgi:hypothetical protein
MLGIAKEIEPPRNSNPIPLLLAGHIISSNDEWCVKKRSISMNEKLSRATRKRAPRTYPNFAPGRSRYILCLSWEKPTDFNEQIYSQLYTYLEHRQASPRKLPRDGEKIPTLLYATVSRKGWTAIRKQLSRLHEKGKCGPMTCSKKPGIPSDPLFLPVLQEGA